MAWMWRTWVMWTQPRPKSLPAHCHQRLWKKLLRRLGFVSVAFLPYPGTCTCVDLDLFVPYTWASPSQVEKPAAGLTPTLHHDMRTKQGKNMKRGRKAKKGKAKGKGTSGTKRTKVLKRGLKDSATTSAKTAGPVSGSKRNLKTLRKMKSPTKFPAECMPDEHDEVPKPPVKTNKVKKVKQDPKLDAPAPKKKKTSAKEEVASSSWEPSAWREVHQNRVKLGRSWRYEVLEGQVWGCSNCRFIWGGCTACRKASFRGKKAYEVFQEQQSELAEAPVLDDGSSKAKRKVKKTGKKAKKNGKTSK